jgi:hypothetical protein
MVCIISCVSTNDSIVTSLTGTLTGYDHKLGCIKMYERIIIEGFQYVRMAFRKRG